MLEVELLHGCVRKLFATVCPWCLVFELEILNVSIWQLLPGAGLIAFVRKVDGHVVTYIRQHTKGCKIAAQWLCDLCFGLGLLWARRSSGECFSGLQLNL